VGSITAPVGLRMAFIRPDFPCVFRSACLLFHVGLLLRSISDPEGGGDIFLQNVCLFFPELHGVTSKKTVQLTKGWFNSRWYSDYIFLNSGLWGYWHCGHSWPLCQPRVIVKMIVEKQMECRLQGETEVLLENLPERHFCPSKNSTWPEPGLNPGRRGGKPATNRLSYGAAWYND
jgi:hypothetical protein